MRSRHSNHIRLIDFVISCPDYDTKEDWTPLRVAEKAAATKMERYSIWNIPEQDIIPFSMDIYGGINKKGLAFIQAAANAIANNNKKMAVELVRKIRDQIAVSLVTTQGRLMVEWNRRNRLKAGYLASRGGFSYLEKLFG